MTSSVLVLSETDVADVIRTLPAHDILSSVGRALHTFSSSIEAKLDSETPVIQNPLRLSVLTPDHNVLFMPSRLGSEDTTSIKIVNVPRDANSKTGLPASTLLLDEATGQTRALLNARALTAVRTAAASALALSLSPHTKEAKKLLIFGSGLQALWHARLVATLSDSLTDVIVASRSNNERSHKLQVNLKLHFAARANVNVSEVSIEKATVEGGILEVADIVCCCTPSTAPLFSGARLKPGASLSMIGSYKPHMREVDLVPLFTGQSALSRRIIVDSKSACLAEAGELFHLREEAPETFEADDPLLVELGSLLDERGQFRPEAASLGDEVTVFKCVGMGVMDSAISALVLRQAELSGKGIRVPF